jgi:hypothetical protein
MIDFPSPEERSAEAKRLLEGLAPKWVANRMSAVDDYSIGKATVRLWKRGERVPDLEDLLRLVVATGRPLRRDLHERIFGGDPPAIEEARPGEPERATLRTEVSDEQSAVDATTAELTSLPTDETPDHPEGDDLAGGVSPSERIEEE